MRPLIPIATIFGTILLVGGCASVSAPPQIAPEEVALARQTVQIYDAMPQHASPLDQLSYTACDGTRATATNQLIAITAERGGNGLTQLSCRSEGMSFSCWSSTTCTGLALNVAPPPPPPPPPPKKHTKPKPKKPVAR
jgi:hypothetical protein